MTADVAKQSRSHESYLPESHVSALRAIETGYWWYVGRIDAAFDMIARWQKNRANAKVSYIDLGCGTGGFANAIKPRIPTQKAALIDGDPAVLRLANAYKDFQILQMDLSKTLKLPWQPDLVTCMDVLEHLSEEKVFLDALYRQLRPGGALVLSVPAFPFLFSEWDRQLGHYRRYTAKSLKTVLIDSGFTIRELKYTWSFLMPIAPYRKFRANRYKTNMEFEQVPRWINTLLIGLARWESKLSRFLSPPFGTSVMVIATK